MSGSRIPQPLPSSVQVNPRFRAFLEAPPRPKPLAANPDGDTFVRIGHINDTHEHFEHLERLVTGMRNLTQDGQAQGFQVFRFHGGDMNTGPEVDDFVLNTRLQNLMHLDGVALGNHEILDLGPKAYAKELAWANFPVMVSNLNIPPESSFAQAATAGRIHTHSQVLQTPQGPFGLIGVTTPSIGKNMTSEQSLEGITVEALDDTIRHVQQEVDALQSQGVRRIFLLSHMGYLRDKKLAQGVNGVDVIIGGHSHKELRGIQPEETVVKSPNGENVVILQAGCHGEWLGKADLKFNAAGQVTPLALDLIPSAGFTPDVEAITLTNHYLGPAVPLANLAQPYDNRLSPFQEDPLANFTADAIRYHTQADIAFVRSGEIRDSLKPGVLTNRDVKAVFPFTDPVVQIRVTGQEILDALKLSAIGAQKRNRHPGMLHPSGMRVVLNSQTGTVESAWVQGPQNRWEPLQPEKTYRVALGGYAIRYSKEYPTLSQPERIESSTNLPVSAFFHWGLTQAQLREKTFPLLPDGRVKIIDAPTQNAPH